jgi:protocatechuate 3,4-dioxygenase beta subunit
MKSLLLFVIFASSCFAPLVAKAQTGVITGRVVAEDGGGLADVSVELYPVNSGQRNLGRQIWTVTEEDGTFKFTGVSPRAYSIGVREPNGFVSKPRPAPERINSRYYRIGDNVVITLIRGGVITGRVTAAGGEPMIGAQVSAVMTRDAEGNPVRRQFDGRQRTTDDRGVYRLYGLAPGTYVVVARNAMFTPGLQPYSDDAPTFYPSSNRAAAAEVTVTSGGEASGVDIRYRGERGYVVSGVMTGDNEISQSYTYADITLYGMATGYAVGSASVPPGANGFAIHGVGDGEYEIIARRFGYNEEEGAVSPPRRVTVKGADVGGIELKLAPQASIAGKVLVEKSEKGCETRRKLSIEEVVVSLRRDEKASERRAVYQGFVIDAAPTDKGDFTIRHIDPGRYFIEPRLPIENWYVKSIAAAAPALAKANTRMGATGADIARDGIELKAGEKLSGVTVTIADGAASLSGKVVAAKEGARLLSRVRIHLAPAEATAADELLRYAEAIVRSDGAFALSNIAPGKYWLIARAAPDDEPGDRPATPAAWDANERAKLRREAEALKIEVELKPCQRMRDQIVKYAK